MMAVWTKRELKDGDIPCCYSDDLHVLTVYPAAAVADATSDTYISNRTIARMKRNNILISPSLLVRYYSVVLYSFLKNL